MVKWKKGNFSGSAAAAVRRGCHGWGFSRSPEEWVDGQVAAFGEGFYLPEWSMTLERIGTERQCTCIQSTLSYSPWQKSQTLLLPKRHPHAPRIWPKAPAPPNRFQW